MSRRIKAFSEPIVPMKEISTNEEKIEELAEKSPINWISKEDKCTYRQGFVCGATKIAKWKDEQFLKEKKEIDEQWKRLMAESKSIGVNLLQRKEEQYKNEKQQLIDKAAEWFSYRFPNMSKEVLEKFKEDMKGV